MTLSQELTWRGFVNQTTLNDQRLLDSQIFKFYFGVDPSGDSMHVGQLAMIMMIRHFLNYGHQGVLLVGGATGLIGDPGGKEAERNLLESETVAQNTRRLGEQYERIFKDADIEIVNNYDWFKDVRLLDFLRDIGKHFSMSELLDRDFVKTRLGENGISYAEFSYSLIQGYDFLHLYRTRGVDLQLAGADQWGNALSGVALIRKLENAEAHVWTAPLVINKATGRKFGKSEGGAIWLDETKTSVYKFYQFWLNVDDESVGDYLKLYTLLDQASISSLLDRHRMTPHLRLAQKTLAYETTAFLHGESRAAAVQNVSEALFGSRDFTGLNEHEVELLAAEIPVVDGPATICSALVKAGAASSLSEARRLLSAGAIEVNGRRANSDFELRPVSLIKKGKNNFILIR